MRLGMVGMALAISSVSETSQRPSMDYGRDLSRGTKEKVMKYGFKILTVLFILGLAACGKNQSQSVTNVPAGYIPNCQGTGCVPPPGGGGGSYAPPFTGGDTETLNLAYSGVLNQYLGYGLNNPGPVSVNIALTPGTASDGTKVFTGQMQIRFQDGPILHNGVFGNGAANYSYQGIKNNLSKMVAPGLYRIFLEDASGALVLMIKAPTGTDTALPPGTATIYFLNFASAASNPLYQGSLDAYGNYFPPGYAYCWMITLGPYNCRNFNVPPTGAYYDSVSKQTISGFQTLGTTQSVDIHAALGI
jgi:hypothetical protein